MPPDRPRPYPMRPPRPCAACGRAFAERVAPGRPRSYCHACTPGDGLGMHARYLAAWRKANPASNERSNAQRRAMYAETVGRGHPSVQRR